jgi:4-alpha-glucanotransferase
MKVLCFAFDGNPQNPYKPGFYKKNCIAYTGTHDNEPFAAFVKAVFKSAKEAFFTELNSELEKAGLPFLDGTTGEDAVCRACIKLLMNSRADVVIFPLCDLLTLGGEARINTPSTISTDNWSYRASAESLSLLDGFLPELTRASGRHV